MAVDADDLRVELGEPYDTWTDDDQARATDILARCLARIIGHIGAVAYQKAIENNDQPSLDVIDEVTLAYAARRFVNPEQTLQRRQGADYSVSFADSSEAASGLTAAEKATLDSMFGPAGGFASVWNASPVETLHTVRLADG